MKNFTPKNPKWPQVGHFFFLLLVFFFFFFSLSRKSCMIADL